MIALLAAALSVDALGIGISYGVRGIRVPLTAKLIISALSVAITACAVGIGSAFAALLPPFGAKLIGAALLFAMGGWIVAQGLKKPAPEQEHKKKDDTLFRWMITSLGITVTIIRNPLSGDRDHSAHLDPLEALYMGMALSVDSIGAGIGSAIAGIGAWTAPLMTGLFQFLCLWLGGRIGARLSLCSRVDSRVWTVLSGVLLLVLAVLKLF